MTIIQNSIDGMSVNDFDDLTGLPGRKAAERAIAAASQGSTPVAFVLFGIDNFRHLNASRGVESADQVLRAVGSAFASVLPSGYAFRIGGDTFGALVQGTAAEAEATSTWILATIRSQRLSVNGDDVRITMSAGVATVTPTSDPHGVVCDADIAMAAAKSAGRDRAALFTPAERSPLAEAAAWADAIGAALEAGGDGFRLHAQPVRSTAGEDVQWELLLRLREQDGRLLAPGEFLPVASRFGMGEAVDRWVLGQALELVAAAAGEGRRLALELNVSARSLTNEQFCRDAADAVRRAGIEASCLTFEVSESGFSGDVHELRHWSSQLSSLGCRFALDNFGSRNASLAQLKHLPVDLVKIDGAFIRHLADDRVDQRIVRSIVELAHDLDQQVAAVQVGDEKTLEIVTGLGVDFVQGFQVGRPVPVGELA